MSETYGTLWVGLFVVSIIGGLTFTFPLIRIWNKGREDTFLDFLVRLQIVSGMLSILASLVLAGKIAKYKETVISLCYMASILTYSMHLNFAVSMTAMVVCQIYLFFAPESAFPLMIQRVSSGKKKSIYSLSFVANLFISTPFFVKYSLTQTHCYVLKYENRLSYDSYFLHFFLVTSWYILLVIGILASLIKGKRGAIDTISILISQNSASSSDLSHTRSIIDFMYFNNWILILFMPFWLLLGYPVR